MLRPVFAVETALGLYLPRSRAADTPFSPKLWASERDAKIMLDKLKNPRNQHEARTFPEGFPRIVRFRLMHMP